MTYPLKCASTTTTHEIALQGFCDVGRAPTCSHLLTQRLGWINETQAVPVPQNANLRSYASVSTRRNKQLTECKELVTELSQN